MNGAGTSIAVLIPCHNEEATIADVVTGFRRSLPDAVILVADNASTDETRARAEAAGAVVISEERQGKGYALGRLMAAVEADCYVMVDGDATYDPSIAPEMCRLVLEEHRDMVCAVREIDEASTGDREYRRGHQLGNQAFSRAFSRLFGMNMEDVFSGYRAMSRAFVKSFLGLPQGFEVEIELNAHCFAVSGSYVEVRGRYRERPEDSHSKLRTYRDGLEIGRALLRLFRDLRPMSAFAILAAPFAVIGVVLGLYAVIPYLQTGLVLRFPSLIAST